ncbi:MAG: MFS transporter, partial [Candidatus Sericytochromatia bacterium]
MAADTPHDPYAPWRETAFARYMVGKTLAMIGQSMVVTAIGWELYERTHDAMALGWVGLVLFVPVVVLSLPAGQIVDRHDRRLILCAAPAYLAQRGAPRDLSELPAHDLLTGSSEHWRFSEA